MLVKMMNNYEAHFKAWSCDFFVEIIEPTGETQHIVDEIKEILAEYEHAFSRFLPTAELYQLNKGKTIKPSKLWENVLSKAIELSAHISPNFNPHVNLSQQGYKESIETLATQDVPKIAAPEVATFPEGLIMESKTLKLKPGSYLDFGSFLKGLVSAQIADKYQTAGAGVVINFGGDITVRGQDNNHQEFILEIYNPVTKADHRVKLKNQTLCTSGTYKRNWKTSEGKTHHILDPKKHRSSDSDFVSISFWGHDGALCDALATAAFSSDTETWDQWIKNTDINYLAIEKTGKMITSVASTQ